MCIGNMRSGMEAFSAYTRTGNRELLLKGGQYFLVILTFFLGAGIGGALAETGGRRMIWISCALLIVSFLLMFLRSEEEKLEEEKSEK